MTFGGLSVSIIGRSIHHTHGTAAAHQYAPVRAGCGTVPGALTLCGAIFVSGRTEINLFFNGVPHVSDGGGICRNLL